jgi:hypothetical protein
MNSNRMITTSWRSLAVFAALALSGCADTPVLTAPVAAEHGTAAAGQGEPVRISFEKCAVAEGIWEGTVAGDVAGGLRTELTDLRVTGPIWQVRFDWIIDAGAQSFTADLAGILNTNTGAVVMNGRVVDGYLLGAQVHEEGQLVDAQNLCFEGTIRIMPATAR